MADQDWGDAQASPDVTDQFAALLDALASLPGVTVTNHEDSGDGWAVRATLAPGPAGDRSFSIISFVTDCRVKGVSMDIVPGGFVLRGGEWGPPIELAWELDYGRKVLREREARN
jgi:hypothetical protein